MLLGEDNLSANPLGMDGAEHWESKRSSKLNDGAGLGTRRDCDGVRIGTGSDHRKETSQEAAPLLLPVHRPTQEDSQGRVSISLLGSPSTGSKGRRAC